MPPPMAVTSPNVMDKSGYWGYVLKPIVVPVTVNDANPNVSDT